MAGTDDFTVGLHRLLHPKFSGICERIEKLDSWCSCLQHTVSLKEDRIEVGFISEHIASQIKHFNHIIEVQNEKHARLDGLRAKEIRNLTLAMEKKAENNNVQEMFEQLHQLTNVVAKKAEITKVEMFSSQIHYLSEDVALKASSVRADQIAKQLQALADVVATKVNCDTADQIFETLKALDANLGLRATCERADDIARRLRVLTDENALKADTTRVDILYRELQSLTEIVDLCARCSTAEHLARELQTLQDILTEKAESAVLQQTITNMHGLMDTVAKKTETSQHYLVSDQVVKLREELHSFQNDLDRIGDIKTKVECLSTTVELDSAKLKNLQLALAHNPLTNGNRASQYSQSPTTRPSSSPGCYSPECASSPTPTSILNRRSPSTPPSSQPRIPNGPAPTPRNLPSIGSRG